jgi:hypothetical protein
MYRSRVTFRLCRLTKRVTRSFKVSGWKLIHLEVSLVLSKNSIKSIRRNSFPDHAAKFRREIGDLRKG